MPEFKRHLKSKLPGVGTSIFAVMSKLAIDHNAINLSQGYPNFETSRELKKMVYDAMLDGKNQYAPMPGIYSLREMICEKTEALHGVRYDPDTEVTVTAGATQAIFTAISAVVSAGDEVIIFKPAYDCYEPTVKMLGGVPKVIQLDPQDFKIDLETVKSLLSEKTRLIIINTPHNPTGKLISRNDMLFGQQQ